MHDITGWGTGWPGCLHSGHHWKAAGLLRLSPTWPTRRSPVFVKATTDGVVRPPSALVMIVGLPPSIAATAELVVPRSMPTTCKQT
jgi:hypothetical protein